MSFYDLNLFCTLSFTFSPFIFNKQVQMQETMLSV